MVCASCEGENQPSIWKIWSRWRSFNCKGCGCELCSNCANDFPLIPFEQTALNGLKQEEQQEVARQILEEGAKFFCKKCFQEKSVLEFDKPFEVHGTRGHPVVILHNYGGSKAMFRPHARALEQRGYRVVLVDLPGHGALQHETVVTPELVESTVLSALENAGISKRERVFIIGSSMGAYCATLLMARHPERFRGGVLHGLGKNLTEQTKFTQLQVQLVFSGYYGLIPAFTQMSLLSKVVLKEPNMDFPMVWESMFGAGNFSPNVTSQFCFDISLRELLPHIEIPVLWICGTSDYTAFMDEGSSLMKNASKMLYPEGHHLLTHDKRFFKQFIDDVDDFSTYGNVNHRISKQ